MLGGVSPQDQRKHVQFPQAFSGVPYNNSYKYLFSKNKNKKVRDIVLLNNDMIVLRMDIPLFYLIYRLIPLSRVAENHKAPEAPIIAVHK